MQAFVFALEHIAKARGLHVDFEDKATPHLDTFIKNSDTEYRFNPWVPTSKWNK